QVHVWHDSGTLRRHAIAATPDCSICHAQLGTWLLERVQPAAALNQFEACVALRPDRLRVRIPMGDALVALGRDVEAIEQYRRVLERYPDLLPTRLSLAGALVRTGRLAEAAARLIEAPRFGPPEDVADYLRRALAREPGAAIVQVGLIHSYIALRRLDLAREQYVALMA